MRGKVLFSSLCIFICMLLCGCSDEIQNLSDEQMVAIGNYSAGILLKYDANSRSRLVSDAEIEKYDARMARIEELKKQEEERRKQQEEAGETSSSESDASIAIPENTVYSQLSDFYVLPENVSLVYTGYEIADEYSDGMVEASAGKSLLIAKFKLTNAGTQREDFDFFGLKSSYKLTVNNKYTKGVFTTILLEDLATYIGSLDPGTSEQVVLITEMDKSSLENVESLILKIKNVSNEYTIKLQ